MMMALRRSPADFAFTHALDGTQTPKRLSGSLPIAIAVALAVHLGFAAYVIHQKFVAPAEPQTPDTPTITMQTVTLPLPPSPTPVRPSRPMMVHPPIGPIDQTVQPITTLPLPPTIKPVAADNRPVLATTTVDTSNVRPPPKEIRDPTWLSRPTAAEMERYYPQGPLDRGLSGEATLLCSVTAGGDLRGCGVAEETPVGAGFGKAALKLSAYFHMSPRTEDGTPVDGALVRIPIKFAVAAGDEP